MSQNQDTDKGFPNQNHPPYAALEIVAPVPLLAVPSSWQSSNSPHEIPPRPCCPVTQSRLNLPNDIYLDPLEESNIMKIRPNNSSDVSHHNPHDNAHTQTTYFRLDYSSTCTSIHNLRPHSHVECGNPLSAYPFQRFDSPHTFEGVLQFIEAAYPPTPPHQTFRPPANRLSPADPSYTLMASDQIGLLEQHTRHLDDIPQPAPDFVKDTFNTGGEGYFGQISNLPEHMTSSDMPQVHPPRRRQRARTRLSALKVASPSSDQPQSEAGSSSMPDSGSASPALSEPGPSATDQKAWIRRDDRDVVVWFDPHHQDAQPLPEQKERLSLFRRVTDPVTEKKQICCSYVDPVVPGSECGAVFSQQYNWYRHLKTIHGKKERRDILNDVLTYELSVVLKDPNVLREILPIVCPDNGCTHFINTGRRWNTTDPRPERALERHREECHSSSNDAVLDTGSGRLRKKRRIKYVRLDELPTVYMPADVEGKNHASVGGGDHACVGEKDHTVVGDEDYASFGDEDNEWSC